MDGHGVSSLRAWTGATSPGGNSCPQKALREATLLVSEKGLGIRACDGRSGGRRLFGGSFFDLRLTAVLIGGHPGSARRSSQISFDRQFMEGNPRRSGPRMHSSAPAHFFPWGPLDAKTRPGPWPCRIPTTRDLIHALARNLDIRSASQRKSRRIEQVCRSHSSPPLAPPNLWRPKTRTFSLVKGKVARPGRSCRTGLFARRNSEDPETCLCALRRHSSNPSSIREDTDRTRDRPVSGQSIGASPARPRR